MANPAPSAVTPVDVEKAERKIVLLIDDTPENLAILLDVLGRGYKVLTAESGESALEQLQYIEPDIILLDITKPLHPEEVLARVESQCQVHSRERRLQSLNQALTTEIELQKEIQDELQKRIEIGVVFAIKRDGWNIRFCSDSAKGLFTKYYGHELEEKLPEPFCESIDSSKRDFSEGQIRRGKLQVSFYKINQQSILITLEEIASAGSRAPEALLTLGLTPREAEVLFWIAEGKTGPEIALILNTASATIKKHVKHILEKLGVENRLSAALLANETLRAAGSKAALRPETVDR